jgi:hypothetical protein
MASYTYPAGTRTFGSRDALATSNPEKTVSGANYDTEFNAIETGKLDKSGTDFDGTISDPNAVIDGGTF